MFMNSIQRTVQKKVDLMSRPYEEGQVSGQCSPDEFGRNGKIAEELASLKGKVVNSVLDELFRRKRAEEKITSYPRSLFFYLLFVVERRAEPRHATRVARILEWEELFLGHDRSERMQVPRNLSKIGGQKQVLDLLRYAEKIKEVVYTDSSWPGDTYPPEALHEYDQTEIRKAIATIESRQ